MRSNDRDSPDGHISVHWLDKPLPPTWWERMTQAWPSLPGALIVVVVVLAVIVSRSSVPLPDMPNVPDVPEVSLPAMAGDDGLTNEQALSTPAAGSSGLATAVATAAPLSGATGTPAPATETAVAVDPAAIGANELGGVPIIMYHAFVHDPALTDEWTLTFDQFRDQLDWFREHDFVMVGMQSMVDGRFDVPTGKKPVILTFDDSNAGQFGLQEAPGGGYEVQPDTAVGVLEEYREAYPEFHGPAFFAILPWNCFGSEDDPSTCEERLNWLVDHGYEVGNHTADHVDMTDVSADFFVRSIAEMELWLNERVPEGPGNLSYVLVLPFGAYPADPDQRSWLRDGFWYLGEPVPLEIVLGVNGGPAKSPYAANSDPSNTFRIASDPGILSYWQEQILSGAAPVFVSDGDPETVTVPESRAEQVNMDKVVGKGLELRTWEDG